MGGETCGALIGLVDYRKRMDVYMCRRFHPFTVCGGVLLSLSFGGAGCSKRPESVEPEKPAQAAERTETGVGDVVDYLTGKTPLDIKKRIEDELRRITQERDKQLREILDADASPSPESPASQPPAEAE